jgi:hypothetical protein
LSHNEQTLHEDGEEMMVTDQEEMMREDQEELMRKFWQDEEDEDEENYD